MDGVLLSNDAILTHGQTINRDGTVPIFLRAEGDGKEHAPDSSDPAELSVSRRRFTRPTFFDGKNRNSTDVALVERHRQQDAGLTPASRSNHSLVLVDGEHAFCRELEDARNESKKLKSHLKELETQLQSLKNDQEEMACEAAVQNQVSKDLKKLLVASMGADLQSQLEHLSTERAQLAQDLENTIKTLVEERETLERVNIQCDVWRSKFLGSRLQVDEAVSSRTRLDMVLQESCFALKNILEERDEIRAHMMQTQRLLQYLSNALQRTHSLSEEVKPSSNVVTLALLNEQIASMISKHLLGDVGHSQTKTKSKFDFVEWTSAEMLAKDILLNRQPALKLEQLQTLPTQTLSSSETALNSSPNPSRVAQRFHPLTKYENLTINCCKYCTGDIKLV